MASKYQDSPFGTGVHIHVNKADSKFKPDAPEFKVDLSLDGEEALKFKELVDAQAEAAFENFKETEAYAKMKPKDQRELVVYYPYEEVEDDEGNKTGEIIFDFRQNERIKLKDGTFKTIKIGIYDAKGSEMSKLVRSGSELRVKFSFRAIPMPSLKKAGIRLDFAGVQVRKLATGNGGIGFGAVDGYEDDGETGYAGTSAEDNSPASGSDGDY
ncbi:hypothetical protein ACQZ6C_10645 [Rhizobium rhizogenes]